LNLESSKREATHHQKGLINKMTADF
jgi:hypothetical protein